MIPFNVEFLKPTTNLTTTTAQANEPNRISNRLKQLQRQHEQLIKRRNRPQKTGNGILTVTNFPCSPPNTRRCPGVMTSTREQSAFDDAARHQLRFHVGAMEWNGNIVLMARVEGWDRKSFFAVAESKTGVDGFRFRIIRCECGTG